MKTIQTKRADAQAAYSLHVQHLHAARQAYDNGPAAAYAAALDRQARLTARLADAQAALAQHEAAFRTQFAGADFEMSKAARDALAKRRDAELICGELKAAAEQTERDLKTLELEASELAIAYRNAYQSALQAHSELSLLSALAEHGQAIAAALASVPTDHVTGRLSDEALRAHGEADERAITFVAKLLKTMADEAREARSPVPEEIGAFDPGALRGRLQLSPVRLAQLRQELGMPRRTVVQETPADALDTAAERSPVLKRLVATARADAQPS